ncbi:hypothetical protein [Streptomyces alfalfae]|uniref:Uncharacterized protein n=1 Tax=Streptomyces alfalfae TaxID=1642299 RepID=A0A7T4PBV5_9ACTN|nr:hypothetical protein [Streptomyces alfalfae]QQC87297.1 hypothetical protein I8755_01885 [Streptomyces alfalfae]
MESAAVEARPFRKALVMQGNFASGDEGAGVVVTYGLLTIDGKVIEAMPRILVEAFDVRLSETDMSSSFELEFRNWDAWVTCEYEAVDGDLAWSLLIYATREVKQQPSEEELATLLLRCLQTPMFFAWGEYLPGS